MKIERFRILSGPNIYTSHPAILAQLDFTDLIGKEIGNVNENLFALVPSLRKKNDSLNYTQSFDNRLADAEFLNQVVTNLTVEFSHLASCDIEVNNFKSRPIGKKSNFCNVIVEYKSVEGMRYLLETAVEVVGKLFANEPLEQIKEFYVERLAQTRHLILPEDQEFYFRGIVKAAKEKDIPVQIIDQRSLQLGYGKNSRTISFESDDFALRNVTDETSSAAIIEKFYPPHKAKSRIPLISVTGTNGKTTVTRLISHIFKEAGNRVGMTTTDGVWVNNKCVATGDTTGPKSAKVVLSDPTVEVAVFETAREGIARRGLGYDWSDVGVITNIQPDHFGQDGIENTNDILSIKSLVAERVRIGGTLVLNADDELLVRLANEPRFQNLQRNIVYFSLKPNHITVKRHTLTGGTAYTLRNGWLVEATKTGETQIIEIKEIPVALGGFAEFNVANALAAVAACRSQNLAVKQIADALRKFQAEQHNHGRANLYEVDGGYVFLDYGHNPEAFKSICKMAAKWDDGERRITGIIAVPGDRANSLVMQAGRVAARGFHRLVIREDADLRGRERGEVAQILAYAAKDEVPDCDCQIILDEAEALKREITRLQRGDILVCFYENFDLVRGILTRCEARPATLINETPKHTFYNFRHA